jgi:phage N-6-adenine-methyltransferase
VNHLVNYGAARQALAAAHAVDEVKDIRDKAAAMAHYAIQAKDTELSRMATEIRLRAERRLGELMSEMPKAKGNREPGTGSNQHKQARVSEKPTPTLADQGIDKNLADRARKAAAMPVDKYEAKIARQVNLAEKAASATGKGEYAKAEFTGEIEWYTPQNHIDDAREVMGAIDLDPASSDVAQKTVRATRYYTAADNALALEWHGRVWMNPPFRRGQIDQFIAKLVSEYRAGRVTEAIVLTHNSTDTEWFQAAQEACSAICFTNKRIRFISADETCPPGAPACGQAFFYFGDDVDAFADVFESIGFIMMPRPRRAAAAVADAA